MLEAPPRPTPSQVLRGMAVPFFLFSLVLLVLLALSFELLLPLFTRVGIGGSQRSAGELRTYAGQLSASVLHMTQERDQSILPIAFPAYEGMKAARLAHPSFAVLRAELLQTASALVPEKDAIHVDAVSYDDANHAFSVTGDVRHVGPRSMTVLAQYVDAIAKIPGVEVSQPSYLRSDDPGTGMHSPFTFRLTFP